MINSTLFLRPSIDDQDGAYVVTITAPGDKCVGVESGFSIVDIVADIYEKHIKRGVVWFIDEPYSPETWELEAGDADDMIEALDAFFKNMPA